MKSFMSLLFNSRCSSRCCPLSSFQLTPPGYLRFCGRLFDAIFLKLLCHSSDTKAHDNEIPLSPLPIAQNDGEID